MDSWLAFLRNGSVIDIGEFPTAQEAESWAVARYGDALEAVDKQVTTTVNVTATDPATIIGFLIIAAIVWSVMKGR